MDEHEHTKLPEQYELMRIRDRIAELTATTQKLKQDLDALWIVARRNSDVFINGFAIMPDTAIQDAIKHRQKFDDSADKIAAVYEIVNKLGKWMVNGFCLIAFILVIRSIPAVFHDLSFLDAIFK